MYAAELDSTNLKLFNDSRIKRIARGSGHMESDVRQLLEEYKKLTKICGNMKGLKPGSRNMNAQQMSKMIPPQMLKQMGGIGGLQGLMKSMSPSMFGGMK